jgi:hypothetical protein
METEHSVIPAECHPDHAPLVIDIDSRYPFDAGWASAESRIAARRGSHDEPP